MPHEKTVTIQVSISSETEQRLMARLKRNGGLYTRTNGMAATVEEALSLFHDLDDIREADIDRYAQILLLLRPDYTPLVPPGEEEKLMWSTILEAAAYIEEGNGFSPTRAESLVPRLRAIADKMRVGWQEEEGAAEGFETVTCPRCKGEGRERDADGSFKQVCIRCFGSGQIEMEDLLPGDLVV